MSGGLIVRIWGAAERLQKMNTSIFNPVALSLNKIPVIFA
jgi:hypothetical protein